MHELHMGMGMTRSVVEVPRHRTPNARHTRQATLATAFRFGMLPKVGTAFKERCAGTFKEISIAGNSTCRHPASAGFPAAS